MKRLATAMMLCAACNELPDNLTVIDPVYADPCRFETCSERGRCTANARGEPACLCDVGYGASDCSLCAVDYHRDYHAECAPDRYCSDLTLDPCGDFGRCRDELGVITCACDLGYEGPRCELCRPGYGRNAYGECLELVLGGDAGAPRDGDPGDGDAGCQGPDCGPIDCEDNPILGPGLVDFEGRSDFPTFENNCVANVPLGLTELRLSSIGGDGVVWACSPNTLYGLDTPHVFLEAGREGAAELTFVGEIARLSFDYAARSSLLLEVVGDGDVVETLGAARRTHGAYSHTFDPPVRIVSLRSIGDSTQQIALDQIAYEPPICTDEASVTR